MKQAITLLIEKTNNGKTSFIEAIKLIEGIYLNNHQLKK